MNYHYKAKFEKTELIAAGTVTAENEADAIAAVYGMCGAWTDEETGYEFTAGCPDTVEVSEVAMNDQQYAHIKTGCQDTRDGWISSYTDEELEERGLTAEQAFDEDDGVTLYQL
jgi:hypothetical protein